MTEPFVPFHAEVAAPGATPERWMLVLHGILGSGSNWRTFVKRLASEEPSWGFVLVDLRMHGRSQGAPPPHTIARAAEDLFEVERAAKKSIRGVLGHSFGGKVALAYVARRRSALDQAWIIDANPSVRDADRVGSMAILRVLEMLPSSFARREEFSDKLLGLGIEKSVVDWLATNVRIDGDRYRFALDLAAVRAMLEDYFAFDAWPIVEADAAKPEIHLVVGGKSDGYARADRERAERDAREHPNVHYHLLPNADHWVHVDDPDGLIRAMRAAI